MAGRGKNIHKDIWKKNNRLLLTFVWLLLLHDPFSYLGTHFLTDVKRVAIFHPVKTMIQGHYCCQTVVISRNLHDFSFLLHVQNLVQMTCWEKVLETKRMDPRRKISLHVYALNNFSKFHYTHVHHGYFTLKSRNIRYNFGEVWAKI